MSPAYLRVSLSPQTGHDEYVWTGKVPVFRSYMACPGLHREQQAGLRVGSRPLPLPLPPTTAPQFVEQQPQLRARCSRGRLLWEHPHSASGLGQQILARLCHLPVRRQGVIQCCLSSQHCGWLAGMFWVCQDGTEGWNSRLFSYLGFVHPLIYSVTCGTSI